MADIFMYIIIGLMLFSFLYSEGVALKSWLKSRSGNTPREEDITGYSCINFNLAGTPNDCEESIAIKDSIEKGQTLTCMISPSGRSRDVSVNVQWFEIGLIPEPEATVIHERIFSGNYVSCFLYERKKDESGKEVFCCRYVYRNSKGVYDFISDISSLKNGEDRKSPEIDLKNYLVLSVTGELVNRLRHEYVSDKDGIYPPKVRENAIEEDDFFFRRFVIDLLRGFIVNKQDKSEFMRECGKERVYGNNRILRKRITNYLRETGFFLAK